MFTYNICLSERKAIVIQYTMTDSNVVNSLKGQRQIKLCSNKAFIGRNLTVPFVLPILPILETPVYERDRIRHVNKDPARQ